MNPTALSYQGIDGFYRRHTTAIQLVYGAFLGLVAAVLLVVALVVLHQHSSEAAKRNREAETVRVQCERTREFGPAIGADFVRRGVFTAHQGHDYFTLIPKRCPGGSVRRVGHSAGNDVARPSRR